MFGSTKEAKFWKWFLKHEAELLDFEKDQENVFDRLAVALQQVHLDLCFAFGRPETRREFVISAGGIRDAFPAVVDLLRAAPGLEKWTVTGFRPRQAEVPTVEIDGTRLDPDAVEVALTHNGVLIGIDLFMPGFSDDRVDLKQAIYIMLDAALGEYDIETKIGAIEMFPFEAETVLTRLPISELPHQFDHIVSTQLRQMPYPPGKIGRS